jgi:hypothetical protein
VQITHKHITKYESSRPCTLSRQYGFVPPNIRSTNHRTLRTWHAPPPPPLPLLLLLLLTLLLTLLLLLLLLLLLILLLLLLLLLLLILLLLLFLLLPVVLTIQHLTGLMHFLVGKHPDLSTQTAPYPYQNRRPF